MSNSSKKSPFQLNFPTQTVQTKQTTQQTNQTNQNVSLRSVLNDISTIAQYDKAAANKFMQQLSYSQQDVTSQFYNPYTQATNKAVKNLQDLGFDMSNIDDDWYNRNSWLKNYYVYTANTNGLSSTMTNKRASKEQKAAYNYDQLWKAFCISSSTMVSTFSFSSG